MSIVKIELTDNTGAIYTLTDIEYIKKILLAIPRAPFKKGTDRETLRKKYRAMLTDIAKEKGYTKESLHNAITPILFKRFDDFPEYYIDRAKGQSTTNLTVDGLSALIDNLKDFITDIQL